jgi:hypothetical protein
VKIGDEELTFTTWLPVGVLDDRCPTTSDNDGFLAQVSVVASTACLMRET